MITIWLLIGIIGPMDTRYIAYSSKQECEKYKAYIEQIKVAEKSPAIFTCEPVSYFND